MKLASCLALFSLLVVASSCSTSGTRASRSHSDAIADPVTPGKSFLTGGSIGVFSSGGL